MTANICGDCLSAFVRPKTVATFAEQVSAVLRCVSQCNCEAHTVSEHSPCPIDSEEEVAACVSHPNHFVNGRLTHKVLDRAFTQGLSVTRLLYKDNAVQSTLALCGWIDSRKKNCQTGGVVTFKAGDARSITFRPGNARAFTVYDTASDADSAHGDVMATAHFGIFKDLDPGLQEVRLVAQVNLFAKMVHTPPA